MYVKTAASIDKAIEKEEVKLAELRAQRERVIAAERAGVIRRIQEAIVTYAITPADLKKKWPEPELEAKRTRGPNKKKASSLKGKKLPAKYRDGDKSWSGKGYAPGWLTAHEAAGRSRDQYLVK